MLLPFFILIFCFEIICAVQTEFNTKVKEIKNENKSLMEMSTLVFVFDVTGSMSNELDQVKRGASKILIKICENEENFIHDYILVPFSDPQVGPVVHTTNVTEFKTVLQELKVGGGADCPEMSLTGIKISLEISSPNSFIFVFTDADPKDTNLLSDVLRLIREKHTQINFILTGTCIDDQNSDEFQKIASVSTGQIFNLLKNDVHLILEFIQLFLRPYKVNLLAVDSQNVTNTSYSFLIPVDETLNEFIIAVSGKKTTINVTNSSGQKVNRSSHVQSVLNLDAVQIISIKNPIIGIWKITVNSISSYSLRTFGYSDINFLYGFSVEWIIHINETSRQPLKDVKNYIFLIPNNSSSILNLTTCEIITLNGNVVDSFSLYRVHNATDLYFGFFLPINASFYLQINGITKYGFIFRRITSSVVHPFYIETDVISLPQNQTLLSNQSYALTCTIKSSVPFDVRWLKNDIPLNYSNHFTGGGEATLEFLALSLSDSGNYTCLVIFGNETKRTTTNIRIVELIILNQNLSRIELEVNEDYAISCSAVGYPEPKLTWFYNHSLEIDSMIRNDNIAVLPDKTLLLLNVMPDQSGIYSCVAENDAGVGYCYYEVIIKDKNESQFNVTLIKVLAGDKAILLCPERTNNLHTQWLKNDLPLDMKSNQRADEPRFILSNNGQKLKILEVCSADGGYYTCVTTNLNEISEFSFFLEVLIPPFFYENRGKIHISAFEKGNVTFECFVNAHPAPSIIWRKDGLAVPVNKWTLPNVTLRYPGKQILQIHDINKELHSGEYECIAKNEVSSIRKYFILDIQEPVP